MAINNYFQKYRKYLPYVVLTLAILLPLLKPGFILTLDMVFTPKIHMSDTATSSYLFRGFLHVLNFILPGQVIEKILLFLIFFLAGAGMYRLVRYLQAGGSDIFKKFGAYFAGAFYMINPFTYDRLMAGQYSVLLGYALLPFFAQSLLHFLQNPRTQAAIKIAIWAIIIGIVSIHTLGPMLILAVAGLGFSLWHFRASMGHGKKILRFGFLAIAIFLVGSSYWLAPLMIGKGSVAAEISGFSSSDNQAFATTGDNIVGKIGNILHLQGFWAEDRSLFILPQDRVPIWNLVMLFVWLIIVVGIVNMWRGRWRYALGLFGFSALIGILLAIGIFNNVLGSHVALFAGYREPQKFAVLVVLLFCVAGAFGFTAIARFCARQAESKIAGHISVIILFALLIVLTPTIFWGCNNQLAARNYPAGWATINQHLKQDKGDFQTLFLPWHLYMYFGFAGRIIASPAPDYFDKPILVSDNPEIEGAAPANPTSTKRHLDTILPHAENDRNFAQKLADLHIKYILLAKDNDFEKYAYLNSKPGLKLITQTNSLVMYHNENYRGN